MSLVPSCGIQYPTTSLSPAGIPASATKWEAAIRETLARHLGSERRAGGGLFRKGEPHEQALGRTRFKIVVANIPVPEQWSIEQVLGYLQSTSYASKAVLGGRADAFEHDLRGVLGKLAPDGLLEKVTDYSLITARR
jgi:hypothetical protein